MMSAIRYVGDRRLITATVLRIVNKSEPSSEQVDASFKLMWRNQRANGGMSLTEIGNTAFEDAQLEFWEFPLPDSHKITQVQLNIELDRKLPAPYYTYHIKSSGKGTPFIFNRVLRVYDSRLAMMIGLHGDVHSYLDTLTVIPRLASRIVKWIK